MVSKHSSDDVSEALEMEKEQTLQKNISRIPTNIYVLHMLKN